MIRLASTIALLFGIGSYSLLSGQSAEDITGRWLRADKKNYQVDIYACGDSYCGKIVWLKEPHDEQGQPRSDIHNPDPLKRQQPLLGLDVLTGFRFDGKSWKDGKIYSFNRGKYYDARMTIKDQQLHLSVSILFFTRNYLWVRIE